MSKKDQLDVFALNIGRLCNEWQSVECTLEAIFARVAGIPAGPVINMLHVMDARQLIAGIKVGAVSTMRPDTRPWAEEVILAVDYIDNVLRPRRNRYIHDSIWHSDYYGVLRSQREIKLRRLQSHSPLAAWRPVRVEDVKDLRATLKSVRETSQWLWQLDFWRDRADKFPDAKLCRLEKLRPKLLPHDPTGKPVPGGLDPLPI